MDALIFSAALAACALCAGLLARPFDRRIALSGVVLLAAYLALDDFATA